MVVIGWFGYRRLESRICLTLTAGLAAGFAYGWMHALLAMEARLPGCVDADYHQTRLVLVSRPALTTVASDHRQSAKFHARLLDPLVNPDCPVAAGAVIALSWFDPPVIQQGDVWLLSVRLRQPWSYQNPGGFDYERWLFGKRLNGSGYVREGSLLQRSGPLRTGQTFAGFLDDVPRDNTCQTDAGEDAVTLADFRVSDLIGGVNLARSTSINGVINGEDVWRYEFTADDLNLLGVRMGSNSRIVNLSGELWVSAQHNAVIRYWLTMDVESVVVSVLSENPDSALPVTGQIIIRYDVFDIGINPNISQPFGC